MDVKELVNIKLSFYYEISNSVIGCGEVIYLAMDVDGVGVDAINNLDDISVKQQKDIAKMVGAKVEDVKFISKKEYDLNNSDDYYDDDYCDDDEEDDEV